MPEMEKFNEQQYVWDEANSKPVRVQGTSDGAVNVSSVDVLVNVSYDAKLFTWSAGKLSTVKYYTGGLSGTLVLTVTFGYDVDGNLASMVRS